MYDLCYSYNLDPEAQMASMRSMTAYEPRSVSGMEALIQRLDGLCRALDDGQPFPPDGVRLWMEQAASNGDLVARAHLAVWSPEEPDEGEFEALLDDILAAGDADALFAMAELLQKNHRSDAHPVLAEASGSDLAIHAWAIAACRLGAISCAAESQRLSYLCMSIGRCHHASYETFVKQDMVPVGCHPRLEQRVRALVGYFREHGMGG